MTLEEEIKRIIGLYEQGATLKEALETIEFLRLEEDKQKHIMVEIAALVKNEALGIDKRTETFEEFIEKAKEEFFETATEIFRFTNNFMPSYEALASEALDEIQLRINLLQQLQDQGHINLFVEVDKHNNKLNSRGWEMGQLYIIAGGR